MSTSPALISWIILVIGFLQITGTLSSPVLQSGLRGDTLGINGGSEGHAALPSSQHHTQLHEQTETEHEQPQLPEHESDPLSEHDSPEEAHREPHEDQQGEPHGEPDEDTQEGLDRGSRHLPDPDRNISSVENIDGTDVTEGLGIDDGGDIPDEQQQIGGDSEGTDVHHQLLPEESGHEEPEPEHGEHISFLPDNPDPLPVESGDRHGEETFPEDHLSSDSPDSEPFHAVSDGPIIRPLPTVPAEHPDGQQHSGSQVQQGEGFSNVTSNENGTDMSWNDKVELSTKGVSDQQNQTVSAAVTTKSPETEIVSSNSIVQEEQTAMTVISTVLSSPYSITPTPSITMDVSILESSVAFRPLPEMVSNTAATFTNIATVTETIVLASNVAVVKGTITSLPGDDIQTVTQFISATPYPSVQPSYSVHTPSLIDHGSDNEFSTGSEKEMSTISTYIPDSSTSTTDPSSSQYHLYDSSARTASPDISPSSSYREPVTSYVTDQPNLNPSLNPVNSVTRTHSPTVESLPLASQGLVIHDNDGQQQTNTRSSTTQDTSTFTGYNTQSLVTAPTTESYISDNNTTTLSTIPPEGNSSVHPTYPETSYRPVTRVSNRTNITFNLPSTGGSVTPRTPSVFSNTTVAKTTRHYSEIATSFLTTKKADRTSTKAQEKTSRATSVTNVTFPRSTVPRPTSTAGTVKIPSTSHKHIHVSTTMPSVFISIRVQMTLTEFCSQKETFITELVEIVEDHQQIEIQQQQVVLLNIHPKMCDKLAEPFTDDDDFEEETVKVELYFKDTEGKADEQMTKVVSEIIKPGFDAQSESQFKEKLTDVKLIHPNEFVSHVTDPPNRPAVSKPKLETGIMIVIVIASVGGFCCVCLLLLQIIIHRRQSGKRMKSFNGGSGISNVPSMDSIALGVVPKSRPSSGFWNPGLELQNETSDPMNLLNFTSLSNFAMNPDAQKREFEVLPIEMPKLSSVPVGAEYKNRFANVIPFPHSRVKLKKIPEEDNSDYINANYVSGYKHAYKTYIATQAPLHKTVRDFWRMVWEQQSRVILMLAPMQQNGQPSYEPYWPDTEGMDACLQFGDITLVLKKKDVQQEYTTYILQLKDIENNLIREIHHFWYTSWPRDGTPEPISLVKFILDTRPHFEDSGAPVVIHCGPGTGRTGTLIAIDICMRSFEDRRKVDVLNCVHCIRGERAGAVQTKEQYHLIYSAIHEYATIVTSPKVSISSTAEALHNML
ncbi:receptor-type tyrosine-protein phosphatase F-like [Mizuhopecten yessoensis]|uniref:Receptor-type tyrosine-protein phosphatase kappa n=1 Tax=Mizuhopecten yessoensis TaxID=6573 RepID=A0A210QU86_MIZYE|nr:receptor-type tyrosine-protein phosphatase F-like [Mizuhopecten yessoensis]XP_021349615.1 receptor-type tyrosine-protein phosphatase F-like [Mizuhopecten yessoensis]OWF52300.1 Receptor-type tyrosine-protein phosphatase kappa [Mizuhopecten yessoensis]